MAKRIWLPRVFRVAIFIHDGELAGAGVTPSLPGKPVLVSAKGTKLTLDFANLIVKRRARRKNSDDGGVG